MCSESLCLDFAHKFSLPKITVSQKEETPTTPKIETPETNPKTIDTIENRELDTTGKNRNSGENKVDNTSKKMDNGNSSENAKNKSIWGLFILGVIGGLGALFTPCVYPMIPMTVAFFTKETDKAKGKKKALFYGFSILLIYLILGVGIAVIFGEAFSYTLSTHWIPNTLFFLVFLVFAMAFLGMFELTLPSGFVNKMDAKGDKGGYIGIFFIAFTLVLVSFSCTAPIVGTVAILSSGGMIIKAVAAMLGFALVFALPFGLFAFFPQWLNSLPQSGGWLNSVKVVLGFLELALAFKFLSQADLVYHWGILDRDVFLSIWIVLSILLGFYLLGKIKFPHDSDLDRVPVPRFLAAVAAFIFGLYMVPGLWGAPLKPLAGFIPPMSTQDFHISETGTSSEVALSNHKYANEVKIKSHLPIDQFFDYNEALAEGKKQNKPIFIDFTGNSCANCRKMEEYVWPEKEVLNYLKDSFIVLSLVCDETFKLPETEWVQDKNGKTLKTMGDVNIDRLSRQFGKLGQPFYFILDWNENVYGSFEGYNKDYTKFRDFLASGKKGFEDFLEKQ
ncbi:MAG: thioredoxin family protein [Flavobacteriales bacterium]|nr:thioredoxin family protein [Flavobacteriales bacterium]